jgi:hypothetical protein
MHVFPFEYGKDSQNTSREIYSFRFCRAFHDESSGKKKKDFIICLCKDIQKIQHVSIQMAFQKTCFAFFSKGGFYDMFLRLLNQSIT